MEARALEGAPRDPEPLAELLENGSLAVTETASLRLREAKEAARRNLSPERATLTWYYGGVYFSYQQALELDALRYACRVLSGPDRDRTAVAALLGAASDTVSTVGNHFAQPVQPRRSDGALKRSWIPSVTRRRRLPVFAGFEAWLARYAALPHTAFPCTAVQSDFRDTLSALSPAEVGVIYADPPYTRDHYSRFYHVLETIAVDDDPGVAPGLGSAEPARGLYREHRHQSPFSIRSQARAAFQELFSHAKRLEAPLVLSYSPMSAGTKARPETRLMSINDLTALASDYFDDIRMLDIAASRHSRFNRVELNAANEGSAEVLIIATS
jgi:adenine-specific DNA-methyltransferase